MSDKNKLLKIEHKKLAHHLLQAATRYTNINAFLRDIENKEEQIKANEAKRQECIDWASLLDPEGSKTFLLNHQATTAWRRSRR
jgi:hypothetical protein